MERLLMKKFRTDTQHYVYDTWTNEILKADARLYEFLPDEGADIFGDGSPDVQAAFASAQQQGYFSPGFPDIANFTDVPAFRKGLTEEGPQHLVLNITEQCNLRCRYCSFSGAYEDHRTHSGRVMSDSVLEAALDFYDAFPGEQKSIGFYGGEPLLEMPLIRRAVESARRRMPGPVFRLTTNATLLSAEVCRFLIDNDFRLTISIDGPGDVHDRYRVAPDNGGSFKQVWSGIQRLRDLDTDYFRRAVSFNLVAAFPLELPAIYAFMEDHPEIFGDHRISVASVNPHPSTLPDGMQGHKTDDAAKPQKQAMFELFREKLLDDSPLAENFPVALFKNDFLDVHERSMSRMSSPAMTNGHCLPGYSKCYVSVSGILYACERMGENFPIGTVADGFDIEAIIDQGRRYDDFIRHDCSRCWAIRLCTKCFIHLYRHGDFSQERLYSFCSSAKRRWSWVLAQYCRLREERANAFDRLLPS